LLSDLRIRLGYELWRQTTPHRGRIRRRVAVAVNVDLFPRTPPALALDSRHNFLGEKRQNDFPDDIVRRPASGVRRKASGG